MRKYVIERTVPGASQMDGDGMAATASTAGGAR